MEEVEKLLDESSKRLQDIIYLITKNLTGEVSNTEMSNLFDITKEMDNMNQKAKIQQAAVAKCKSYLSQADEPWNCNIQQMFDENLETEKQKSTKSKEKYYNSLKKYVNKKENQGIEEIEVVEEAHTAIDPWTKQPIKYAVYSKTCKHVYDKRSIACIIKKNRIHFKCPYVGCQNQVSQEDLVDTN